MRPPSITKYVTIYFHRCHTNRDPAVLTGVGFRTLLFLSSFFASCFGDASVADCCKSKGPQRPPRDLEGLYEGRPSRQPKGREGHYHVLHQLLPVQVRRRRDGDECSTVTRQAATTQQKCQISLVVSIFIPATDNHTSIHLRCVTTVRPVCVDISFRILKGHIIRATLTA